MSERGGEGFWGNRRSLALVSNAIKAASRAPSYRGGWRKGLGVLHSGLPGRWKQPPVSNSKQAGHGRNLVAQTVKSLPAVRETRVRSLGWEDTLAKKWQPTPVFLLGKSHRRRSLAGYSPWGRKASDTTQRLHFLSLSEVKRESWADNDKGLTGDQRKGWRSVRESEIS